MKSTKLQKKVKQTIESGTEIVKKEGKLFLKPFLFGVLFSIIFSAIEYLLLLITEETLTKFLEKSFHNTIILTLIKASISSVIALLVVSFIEKKLYRRNINIMRNPYIDVFGILVGCFLVIFVYYIIVRMKTK